MRARLVLTFAFLVGAFAGCYGPTLPDAPFLCSSQITDCPTGFTCDVSTRCASAGKCSCRRNCNSDGDCTDTDMSGNSSTKCDPATSLCIPRK